MKSDILDKFLILLLILILPVSIYFSSQFQMAGTKKTENQIRQEEAARVDKVLEEIKSQAENKAAASQPKVIEVSKVEFASKSGELIVEGEAPGKNLNIMVSAVISPPKLISEIVENGDASDSAEKNVVKEEINVLGDDVEVMAVKTDSEGKFKFVKIIDPKEVGLIELRFDQDRSSATVQYDFVRNERTF